MSDESHADSRTALWWTANGKSDIAFNVMALDTAYLYTDKLPNLCSTSHFSIFLERG